MSLHQNQSSFLNPTLPIAFLLLRDFQPEQQVEALQRIDLVISASAHRDRWALFVLGPGVQQMARMIDSIELGGDVLAARWRWLRYAERGRWILHAPSWRNRLPEATHIDEFKQHFPHASFRSDVAFRRALGLYRTVLSL